MAFSRRHLGKLSREVFQSFFHGSFPSSSINRINESAKVVPKFDFLTNNTLFTSSSVYFRAFSSSSSHREGKNEKENTEASKQEEIELASPGSALFGKEIEGEKPEGVNMVYSDEFFEQDQVDDEEIESLLTHRNLRGVPGLPPLSQLMEEDPEAEAKARRREFERLKQEETKKLRVQQVDEHGRAYATGRRKTSSARVWIWQGSGKISVNRLPFDSYFPDLNVRSVLLQPFLVSNTLGQFDVRCTVSGGGVSGQVGAIRHGVSKALQLFDPELRASLKKAGFLTRDPRVVERKKPGKAKARKSFQWVKR